MSERCIVAVIVTFNRLALLKDTISSLLTQDLQLSRIIVVNNNSSDGTTQYLENLSFSTTTVKHMQLSTNIGGAGGFSVGIEEAMKCSPNFVWLMDDDTIPASDALSKLVNGVDHAEGVLNRQVGFACSKAIWTDGAVHRMNVPSIASFVNGVPFNFSNHAFAITSCTFVSVLIRASVIQQVGLPYREYFIWVDDVEYTTRITNRGYMGIYVTDSEVHHKTGSNYTATIADGTPASAWKYFYEVRNKLHFWRVNYTFSKRVIFIPLYSLKFLIETLRRKDNRMRFFWIVLRGIAAGIFFRPRVRKVSGLVCSITGDTE